MLTMLCSFMKAKSEVSLEDVAAVVDIGLELFHMSQDKLYAQVLIFIFEMINTSCSMFVAVIFFLTKGRSYLFL